MKTQILTTVLFLLVSLSGWTQKLEKAQLIDSLTAMMKSRDIPGMFITVLHKDSVILKNGFGKADLNTGENVSSGHLFKIGSVSKTFTAIAIMQLVEAGKLSLDDNLNMIAPEVPFENKWENTHPVKVKHLLEHKAGFDDMHFNVIGGERAKDMNAFDEVMAHKKSMQSQWKPGLGHSYSNPSYVILGYLIEKFSGMPYQKYIEQQVLLPLGMRYTKFSSQLENGSLAPFATGYSKRGDTVVVAQENKLIGEAAGALLSSADEMAKLLQLLLNDSSSALLDFQSIREMEKLHGSIEKAHQLKDGYSLGLYTRRYGKNDYRFTGHSGGIFGFAADYIYSRELDLGIAIANNVEVGNRSFIDLIVDNYVDDQPQKANTVAANIESFKPWEGTYRMMTTRNKIFNFLTLPFETVEVKVENDSLSITRFLQDKEMYAQTDIGAFQKSESTYPTAFLTEMDGKLYLNYHSDVMQPISGSFLFLLRLGLGLSIAILIYGIFFFLPRLFAAPFKSKYRKPLARIAIMMVPYLCIAGFTAIFLSNATLHSIINLSKVSGPSIMIFFLTTIYPFALILSAIYLVKNWKSIESKFWKINYALIFTGSFVLSIYCISFQWAFLAFWNY